MAKTKAKAKDTDDDSKTRAPAGPVKRDGAYVLMLFITLVAVTTGCVLLYLDHQEYGAKQPPKEAAPTVLKLGDAPAPDPIAKSDPPAGDPPAPMPMPMGDMGMGGMPMGMPMGGMP